MARGKLNRQMQSESSSRDGIEVISVKIGKTNAAICEGYSGTFAFFVDSCQRKGMLPGFHEQGLITEVRLEQTRLTLRLSGGRSEEEIREIMYNALLNTGAYATAADEVQYFIEVLL